MLVDIRCFGQKLWFKQTTFAIRYIRVRAKDQRKPYTRSQQVTAQTWGTCGSLRPELIITSWSRSVTKNSTARLGSIFRWVPTWQQLHNLCSETSKIIVSRDVSFDKSGPTIPQATISDNKVDNDALPDIHDNDDEPSSEDLDYSTCPDRYKSFDVFKHVPLDAETIEIHPITLTHSGRVIRKPKSLGDLADTALSVTLAK